MPLIIVPAGGSRVRQISSPVELIDVFPTLCELSGLPIPPKLHGRSLLPLVTGQSDAVRKGAITLNDAWWDHLGHGWPNAPVGKNALGYSYRTQRYRYTQWVLYEKREPFSSPASKEETWARWTPTGESAGVELFDYMVDPNETINVAQDPSHAGLVRYLASQLRQYCDGCERLTFCTDWCRKWTCNGARWCQHWEPSRRPPRCELC
mmetsp:Transcript_15862/g.31870  ORF Transcript_15862/g.31870 Transcript_15862/m.31870 type:complete len:207 (-) Transcript_15862:212-832(-)